MRVKWRAVAAVAAALVVAGCTVKVAGSASPVPGQGPVVQKVDPCTLLGDEQIDALGFKQPGRAVPASKETRSPAMCLWSSKDDAETSATLNLGWAVDQTLDDFLNGAVAKGQPQQIGGLSWTQYGSILPDDCSVYATLGEKSFAYVSVTAGEITKSCDIVKQVVPQVAAKLPGGSPAPSLTPTSSAPPAPSGPLASLDPCTLLKPDQTAQLKVADKGEKDNSSSIPNASYCLWKDTDGDGGQKAFEVWLGPSTPAGKWTAADGVQASETVDVGGKKWSVYPNVAGTRVSCAAVLPVTDTSSVEIVSGFIGDDSKTCDLVKQGIPLVTGNLPA